MNEAQRIAMDEVRYGVFNLRNSLNRTLYIIKRPYKEDEYPSQGTLLYHPGAMWREEKFDADGIEAWCVVLPNRSGLWWTTYIADDPENPGQKTKRWEIEGQPPTITVTPSINAGENNQPYGWHGHINKGEMNP